MDPFFDIKINLTFYPTYASAQTHNLSSVFLIWTPFPAKPHHLGLFCKRHGAVLWLFLHVLGACWVPRWLPWDLDVFTVGCISSCFPHPEQSSSAICRTRSPLGPWSVSISFTMCHWTAQRNILNPCTLYMCKAFCSKRKGVIVGPGLLLRKGKERRVSQWRSINTAPADRQWNTGGKSPFFSLPSPVI